MKRIIGIIAITLLVISCKKEKTVWETDWSAPLINDTLSIKNLVNDSTLAEVGGFYMLELDRTLFDLNVADVVEIPDTTISENFVLGGSLNLAPGFNFVNSAEEHDLNLEDIQLKKIILREGYIDIRVENPLGTKTYFNVTLPGVSKDGVVFSDIYEAPAAVGGVPGVTSETINLKDYTLDLTGLTGGAYNILSSQITVSTDPFGPSVMITPSDVTKIDATFRDVVVNYARGYFGNRIFSDTSDVFVDFLNSVQSGAIDLPATTIQFEIENGIKVSAEGTITTVSNVNNSANTVDLSSAQIGTSFNIDPATGAWGTLTPSFKVIEFNNVNSNIEAYLENLGVTHNLGYKIQLNPWGNVSGGWDELYSNSKLRIRMKANMPLSIGFDDLVLRDTFDITLNQDPEKTRIKSGELILQASNGFPFSGSVKLIFLDENGNVMQTISGSAALKSSLYGTVSAAENILVANSEARFILTEELITDINDVRAVIVESSFNSINPVTSANEQMNIPVGAFLAIKLKTKFKSENKF